MVKNVDSDQTTSLGAEDAIMIFFFVFFTISEPWATILVPVKLI